MRSRFQLGSGLALACALFFALGWPFVRRLGVEVDEALIANGIYARGVPLFSWKIGGADIPLMILSYLGALKTWIFLPIFAVWEPDATSLRLPMLIAGAATVLLFFVFLDRVAGRTAAWAGTFLLSTDPSFVLNEAIDFGPVALHHFIKLAALVALLEWHRTQRIRWWSLGFFLLGLAMWDKAIFAWSLAGLAAGALVLRVRITPRLAAAAALAFAVGAAPLIAYNIARPLDTFRSNAKLAASDSVVKLWLLHRTVDGSAMFGFFTAATPGPRQVEPARAEQRTALAVARVLPLRGNWNEYSFIAALLALPLLWRTPARSPMLFAALYLAVTWSLMFFTAGAGGSAHHVLLLWPFHLAFIATALAQLPRRWMAVICAAVLSVVNLAVVNQYFADLIRNGTAVRWTDAFPPLVERMETFKAPYVWVADWGILETVNLLAEGRVPVTAVDPAAIPRELFEQPGAIFVSHTAPFVQTPAVGQALSDSATRFGYVREPVSTVYDRNGRAVFDIFRFRRAEQ